MLTQLNSNVLTIAFIQVSRYLSFLSVVFLIFACSSKQSGPQLTGFTMGTSYSIQWNDDSPISTNDLAQEIAKRLERINTLMSTYIRDSQLSEFNQSSETGWHAVDIELATLVKQALDICQQSEGAFDITIGPLVNLWGFGASDANFQFPNDTEINIAMRAVGCKNLQARLSPPAIHKKLADVYVDLSAIAKGYAVDEIAHILDQHGLQHYMVEIGGEIKAKGLAPHGNPWRIGIETPHIQQGNIEEIILLDNIAIATSGDYRNYFEHEGQRYSHTIDPHTGYPIKHQLTSVAIIHKSTAIADAWATAFMVLGANEALKMANTHNLSGLLITRHGERYKKTSFGKMSTYFSK